MSLLLDALKRAEQEKLAKQGERSANDAPANPSPAARRDAANAASLELQPISTPSNAGVPVGARAAAAKPAGAAAAQAVFQAKGAAPKPEGTKSHTILWIAAAVIVVAIAGIGSYVWYSLSSLQPRITTLRPRAAPTPPAAGTTSPAPPKVDNLVAGAIAPGSAARSDTPGSSTTVTTTATTATTAPQPPQAAPVARLEETPAPPRNRAEAAARMLRETPATPSLRQAQPDKPRVPNEVAAGYGALRTGDLPSARSSYAAALTADPASVDAHLGLATVEARLGNAASAASHYRRALDLDPRNPTALAGLASIADMSQPEILEGQLRADIARYPQSAALYFALGNLYASRARWEDAQAAFFEALRIEPASADTLYNLAVSMDHMRQPRLAADYYRRALDAARGQPAQFDPAPVQRRLAELRP